ncbi:MAG: hypothetical protein ACXVJD_04720 [Mucilaginibacter sp.]
MEPESKTTTLPAAGHPPQAKRTWTAPTIELIGTDSIRSGPRPAPETLTLFFGTVIPHYGTQS